MKLSIIALLIFTCNLIADSAYCQNPVPNPSFENWTTIPFLGDLPNGWLSDPSIVTKSTDAHSGSFAAKGTVGSSSNPPSLTTETSSVGFPISFRPSSFEGYYKLTSVQNDFL